MKDKKLSLQKDIEYLLSRNDQFVYVGCPVCSNDKLDSWDSKNGFQFVKCPSCSMIFVNPRPSQRLVFEFYENSLNYKAWNEIIFPATEDVRKEKIIAPRAARLIQSCRSSGVKGGDLLEVGSAFGTFGEVIEALGYFDHYIAVEPTPDLAQTCRDRGFITHETTIEELDIGMKKVDVIAAFEVIEHLFDPIVLIKSSARLLRNGGLLVITCPNSNSIGPLLLKAADQNFNHEHLNYFNCSNLSLLLEKNGFQVVESATPGQLDIELLKDALNSEDTLVSDIPFWPKLLAMAKYSDLQEFQRIIADSGLSSHLWVVARKV